MYRAIFGTYRVLFSIFGSQIPFVLYQEMWLRSVGHHTNLVPAHEYVFSEYAGLFSEYIWLFSECIWLFSVYWVVSCRTSHESCASTWMDLFRMYRALSRIFFFLEHVGSFFSVYWVDGWCDSTRVLCQQWWRALFRICRAVFRKYRALFKNIWGSFQNT